MQYTVIKPEDRRRYRTFATHPWIIRNEATGQRMMLDQRMVRGPMRVRACEWGWSGPAPGSQVSRTDSSSAAMSGSDVLP